jgi:polyferredoxin
MSADTAYLLFADILLLTHTLFVLFVICGLFLIVAGRLLSWRWIRNPWFRLTHLVCIGIVVVQSWFGVVCPLTTWEMALRQKAGGLAYDGSFIAYWLSKVLYYQLPGWVFVLAYTLFGLLVLVSWYWVRPDPFGRRGRGN